ncbi:hypothetical protein QBC38DRAFT_374701, partial [Podospora fimiseda]
PIVTHATVRSSKPVLVEHDQVISSLRASRTLDMDADEGTSSWHEYSPTKSRSQSHQTESCTVSSPGLRIELKNSLKQKRHSVADLRLAFERTPVTPKRRSIATSSESPTKIPTSKAARSRGGSNTAATSSQPDSLRSSMSVSKIPLPEGSKTGMRKTPKLNQARPLLMARTLSVKISTVKPSSPESPTKNHIRDSISQSGTTRRNLCLGPKVLPGPPPSPFLQHWRSRREPAPVKSEPSLPIMVSTTVAATTKRGSNSSDSSLQFKISSGRESGREKSVASSAYSKGYQDGPVESPRKDQRDSPVKDKISIFEHLSRSDSKPVMVKTRSQNHSASSSSKNSQSDKRIAHRPSPWDLKRGARALRALSITGRRDSQVIRTALPLSKQAEKAVKFPVRSRQSVTVPKERADSASMNNSQQALGSKAMGVAPRTDHYSIAPRPDSTFFVKGTMWKAPHTDPKPEHPLFSPKSSMGSISVPKRPSSAELVDKTAETGPTLFYSTSTKSGRILPDRKSYGALDGKKSWDHEALASTTLPDPFLDSSTQNTNLYIQSANAGIPSISFESPTPLPNSSTTSSESNSPALSLPILENPVKSQKRPRYPIIHASFGKKSGDNAKKSAALGPVLSPDLAHADRSESHDDHRRVGQLTQSWGRKAAAAALGITRRLRERRASSSTTNSRLSRGSTNRRSRSMSNRSLRRRDGGSGAGGGGMVSDSADNAVVATPNCRLQHPRPSRKVDWTKFEV